MTQEKAAKEGADAATAAFEEKHLMVHETDIQCEGRWLFEDDIHHLESRGVNRAVSRAAHCRPCCDWRFKILNDNLSVVLAFARSRAQEYRF